MIIINVSPHFLLALFKKKKKKSVIQGLTGTILWY